MFWGLAFVYTNPAEAKIHCQEELKNTTEGRWQMVVSKVRIEPRELCREQTRDGVSCTTARRGPLKAAKFRHLILRLGRVKIVTAQHGVIWFIR